MFRILAAILWLVAALAVVLFVPLLLGRPIGPENIAVIAILTLLGWSLIELAVKAWSVRAEHKAVASFQLLLARMETNDYRPSPYSLRDLRTIRRVNHISECARPDISKLHDAVPAVAALDASILATSYGPLTVYAWCLPVIGFMGTAMGMTQAIGGFQQALSQARGDLNTLVATLGNVVIPGLANAFYITIVALAASLVVHLCTSALRDWDQEALTKLDRLCIIMLSRIPLPEGPEGQRIVSAIERISQQLADIVKIPVMLEEGAKTMSTAAEWLLAAAREMHAAATSPYVVTIERGAPRLAALWATPPVKPADGAASETELS